MPTQTLNAAASSYDMTIGGNVTTGTVDLVGGLTSGEVSLGGGTARTGSIDLGNTLSTGNIGIRTSTGQIDIGPTQTSGLLNIGNSSSRTGNIIIGNSANTGTITLNTTGITNVGAASSATNIGGSATAINLGASQTSGTIEIGTNASRTGDVTIGNALNTGDIHLRTTGFINIGGGLGGTVNLGNQIDQIVNVSPNQTTGNTTIVRNQTSGTLLIGNNATRTGVITIGHPSNTGDVQLRTAGTLKLDGDVEFDFSDCVVSSKGTVTQATSPTTGVTLHNSVGMITTATLSTAAEGSETFEVTNNRFVGSSQILTSIVSYTGTGIPVVTTNNVAAAGSSFQIKIHNAHSSTALSGTMSIMYWIL